MDISAAALPPIQPPMPKDTAHPLYAKYMGYRSACSSQLIEAMSFGAYCRCAETEEQHRHAESHPRFKEFQNWMRDTQAGARKGPGIFPQNFYAWLDGARW